MRQTDDVYRGYLEEMRVLEEFRMTYAGMHPAVSLERDDPDVRRLIEAMAFFTARTRAAALGNILSSRRRLFQQFFSYLLAPLPAAAMLRAIPGGRFAEPVTLPRGTEIVVTAADGEPALFRTLGDLRILPVRLEALETLLRPKGGTRLVLDLRAAYPRNDEVGILPIRINHLDDYHASLQALSSLRKHLAAVSVLWDERVTDLSHGTPCRATFGVSAEADAAPGTTPAAPPEVGDVGHTIQQVRSFFHFPERELYLNVDVPPPPRNWKRLSIILDLDPGFPRNLRLSQDVFRLYVVPLANLKRGRAEPFLCDGKQERYAIRYPEPRARLSLHSVLGVAEIAKEGLVALRPGIVMGGGGSFEQEDTFLKLNFPDAFQSPKKIAVDALWFQPWFSERAKGRLDVAPHDRTVAGVGLEVEGEVRPHVENSLRGDVDGLLQILALKNKTTLSLGDLTALLNALGSLPGSAFKGVPDLIASLEATTVPAREPGAGVRHIYRLALKEFDPSDLPIVEVALAQIARLLDAWVSEGTAVVEATVPGIDEKLRFEPADAGRLW